MSQDGYFFECLNILISSCCVCAEGFQSLTKAFHYSTQLLTFYLLLWNYLLNLKMLNENLLKVPSLWLVEHSLAPTSIFVPLNRILSCFLFRRIVRNRIPSACFYFCSSEQNSKLLSLLQNGSERYSESLLIFLFHGTEFRAFFSSEEWYGTEFWYFSVPRNIRSLEQTICSVYSIFRWIIFLSEIANPKYRLLFHLRHSLLGLELMALFINW